MADRLGPYTEEYGWFLAKLIKLSVCDCNFPTLDERIGLGTMYRVFLFIQSSLVLGCGGCGKIAVVKVVVAWREGGGPPRLLPLELFEIKTTA